MEQQKKQLSEHDRKLLAEIYELDKKGYVVWPNIQDLADELEDETERKRWNDRCTHYNHIEEGHAGIL